MRWLQLVLLGYFSPVIVRAKILLQEMWKLKVDWDSVLPDFILEEWKTLAVDLQSISSVSIKRHVSVFAETEVVDLHCFCDASCKAYSACVYLRSTTGNIHEANLIFCKSRVAPLKAISLPRLELMAVLLGVRSLEFVSKQLNFPTNHRKVLWSDSMCVLHWIKSKRLLSTFVENRLKEIRKSKDIEYRYVPTKENSVDLATEGERLSEIAYSELWWNGPAWLSKDECNWPKFPEESVITSEAVCEIGLCEVSTLDNASDVSKPQNSLGLRTVTQTLVMNISSQSILCKDTPL